MPAASWLYEPDEAFVNSTGEIVTIHHAILVARELAFVCKNSSGSTTLARARDLTFLTNKYDWQKTANTNARSQLASAKRSRHVIR